jgi:acetyl-CoA carboxylase biotin carboxyl carrier protein
MDLKDIKQLIRLVDEKKFAEFELEKGDFKLRIKRNETPVVHYTSASPAAVQDYSPASSASTLPSGSLAAATSQPGPAVGRQDLDAPAEADLHIITSPIVGTFYRAPGPTAEPFVRDGDYVQPGMTLCVVEAMKLMNEIPSDVAGQVVKSHVENGHPVEFGQPLFSINVKSSAVSRPPSADGDAV